MSTARYKNKRLPSLFKGRLGAAAGGGEDGAPDGVRTLIGAKDHSTGAVGSLGMAAMVKGTAPAP